MILKKIIKLHHFAVFRWFTMYPAAAAAVRVPESAGFGPEGGPGSQGGACTGDFTHSNGFSFHKTVRTHSLMFVIC